MTQVLGPQAQDQTYTFSSHPSAIENRQKYRNKVKKIEDQEVQQQYGNLMYDRRVVRGNTYSQHLLPISTQPDPVEMQRQMEARRRAVAKKRARDQLRPRTPDPVDGRLHQNVQTELYLEELADRIEEADVEAQTDDFLDRPATPLFVPAKSGADVATEILPGDLFHYDTEVKPVLEVLVGKTLEQACLEVLEEEELEGLRRQQRMFMELRNAEKVEQQRLEEQDRRLREEKKRRMQQKLEVLQMEKETAEKVAAKVFAQSYLSDLVPTVFGTLADHGYFFDPVERDVEVGFLPWLMDSVCEELDLQNESRLVLDVIIRKAAGERHAAYRKLDEQIEQARLDQEAEVALGGRQSGAASAEDTADKPEIEPGNAETATTEDSEADQQKPEEDEGAPEDGVLATLTEGDENETARTEAENDLGQITEED